MDRRAWQATVHGVAKESPTRLKPVDNNNGGERPQVTIPSGLLPLGLGWTNAKVSIPLLWLIWRQCQALNIYHMTPRYKDRKVSNESKLRSLNLPGTAASRWTCEGMPFWPMLLSTPEEEALQRLASSTVGLPLATGFRTREAGH